MNSLFHALEEFERRGLPAAKIDRVVFNRVKKDKNAPAELHAEGAHARDATLSFSPVKAVLAQISLISDHLYEAG